jgi:glycosyltransferase involved in cell wall biosynthesis
MKIGIDISPAINEKAGIGRYSYNLVTNLLKIDHKNQYFLFSNFIRDPDGTKKERLNSLCKPNSKVKNYLLPGKIKELIWKSPFISPIDLLLGKVDVFHGLNFLCIPYHVKSAIVTIYDLAFLKFPEQVGKGYAEYFTKATKNAVFNSDIIISISQSTKDDLIELLQVPKEKIKVIYLGVEDYFFIKVNPVKRRKIALKYNLPQKYILYVGTLEPRKNIVGLVKAFNLLNKNLQTKYKLVIAGEKGWLYDEIFQTVANLKLGDKVIFTGFIPDCDLPAIYQGAKIFVLPSFYEGFGLPILEAMASGCPTISSNTSSMPEVVGDAGILINPSYPEEITQAIKKLLSDQTLYNQLKNKGEIQAQKFSWQKCGQETLRVYEEAYRRTKELKNGKMEK